jgi:hypothetical protein
MMNRPHPDLAASLTQVEFYYVVVFIAGLVLALSLSGA